MTLHLDDARWRAAVDAELVGDATDEQREQLARYRPRGAEHRAEHALLEALRAPEKAEGAVPAAPSGLDDAGLDDAGLDDAGLVDAVVAAFMATDAVPVVTPPARRWSRAVVPALMASAAAIALWFSATHDSGAEAGTGLGSGTSASTAPVASASPAPNTASTSPTLTEGQAGAEHHGWRVTSGNAALDSGGGAIAARLPDGLALVATAPLCTEHRGTRACVPEGTRFSTAGTDAALVLTQGQVQLRTEAQPGPGVAVGELRIQPEPHSMVVVERSIAGWSVKVEQGRVAVVEHSGQRFVSAGETLERQAEPAIDDASSPKPRPGTKSGPNPGTKAAASGARASELLRQARQQRRDGKHSAALTTYRQLQRRYPNSAAARTATVSSGQLRLQRGDAKAALEDFRRYLERGGALAQDAAYGEVRALRTLGRHAEADRAAKRFVARYPDSAYGAKLSR